MKTPLEESPSLLSTHTLPSNAPHRAAARSPARQTATASSTLIEFPGSARAQRPAWRKELSERVREIQERRAREAMGDDANQSASYAMLDHESAAQGLGLVPPSPTPPVEERQLNPIVVAALARVERARQTQPPPPPPLPSLPPPSAATTLAAAPSPINTEIPGQTHKRDAPAAAANSTPASNDSAVPVAKTVDTAPASREMKPHLTTTITTLGGVDINSPAYLKHKREEEARAQAKRLAAKQTSGVQTRVIPPAPDRLTAGSEHTKSPTPRPRAETDAAARASKPAVRVDAPGTTSPAADAHAATRRVNAQVLDDAMLARLESEEAAAETARRRKSQDDYAPFTARLAAGVIDVISVIFLSSPIAAALELAYGNWSDSRTMLTMTISAITITFLYVTAATALAGRTWGMALVNLRAVDVESGMIPTTSQAVRRGAGYVVSLVLFGLGLLYALIDPERRGAHDHFSGTVVVRE